MRNQLTGKRWHFLLCGVGVVFLLATSTSVAADDKPVPQSLDEIAVAEAKLHVTIAQTKVRAAKVQLLQATLDLERVRKLQATRAVTAEEVALAETRHRMLENALASAENDAKLAEVAVSQAEEKARHNRAVGEGAVTRAQLLVKQAAVTRKNVEQHRDAAAKQLDQIRRDLVKGARDRHELDAATANLEQAEAEVKAARAEENRAALALEKAKLWLRFRSGPVDAKKE